MLNGLRTFTLTSIFLAALVLPSAASPLTQTQAENQARLFLQMLDNGLLDSAWQEMSSLFQILSDQADWKLRQQVLRTAYGTLFSRELKNVSYRATFSQSPDGQYVVILFQSSYQNKAESRETVVLDCSNGTDCPIRQYVIQ